MTPRDRYTRAIEYDMLNHHVLRDHYRVEHAVRIIIGCLLVLAGLAAWWGLGQP